MIWSDSRFHREGPAIFSPYSPEQIRQIEGQAVKSFGQSSAGYDVRAGTKWRIPSRLRSSHVVDLREPQSVEAAMECHEGSKLIMPPGSVALCEIMEHITMPLTAMAVAWGKSTDQRRFVNVTVSPLEPGWRGMLVIEIRNDSPFHQVIWAGEGIAQLVFLDLDHAPIVGYGDRPSLYQDQSGVMGARLV